MTSRLKMIVTLAGCVFGGWLGWSLAARQEMKDVPHAASSPPSWHAPESRALEPSPNEAMLFARTLARCPTDDLWELLREPGRSLDDVSSQAIVAELFDRQGIRALQISLESGEGEAKADRRGYLPQLFLEMLAKKDPWAAYAVFQQHRDRFYDSWAPLAREAFILASCGISAERTVEVAASVSRGISYSAKPDFPADYAFRSALEAPALATSENINLCRILLSGWVRRDPVTAVDWVVSRNALDRADSSNASELCIAGVEVGQSHSPARAAALERLSGLSEELRGWIGSSLADHADGKMDAALLDVAVAVGQRESYLTSVLLETRGFPALDASWSALPKEFREPVLDAALAKWSEEDPGPLATEARVHWKEMVRRGWAAGTTK
ncbi:MAG: hypothetical protein JWO82_4075 [Akkermansiaceae bacterium]|nr:hypothetical protein [Akkermansiaceae bacterium]